MIAACLHKLFAVTSRTDGRSSSTVGDVVDSLQGE